MKPLFYPANSCCCIEIGHSALRILDHRGGLDLPLTRLENGRLDDSCKERLVAGLQGFLNHTGRFRRRRAVCALSARGVSLRRLVVPSAARDDMRQLLALQLENEFPLPPEAFAWGFYPVPHPDRSGTAKGQEVVVAAVKREVVIEYAEVLTQCGLDPVFTLAALARSGLCSSTAPACDVLEVGRQYSELALMEHGVVTAARILPWGSDGPAEGGEDQTGCATDPCGPGSAEALAELLIRAGLGSKVCVSGEASCLSALVPALSKALGSGIELERVDYVDGPGRSAATLGLQKLCQGNGLAIPLTLEINLEKRAEPRSRSDLERWIALACLLVVALIGLRYAEAYLRQPQLAKKLAALDAQRGGLPGMDRELEFLTYLQTNQPPFLEALSLVANAAPSGTRLDSVSMSRRGDLSLRGTMANSQQTVELRGKLIQSGFFSAVVLDEQAPTPDRQKVTFRLTAQLKPNEERPSLPAVTPATGTNNGTNPAEPANQTSVPSPGPHRVEVVTAPGAIPPRTQ